MRNNDDVVLQEEFEVKTGGRLDTIDVTDDILGVVAASGVRSGSALVFSPHTTCCVLIAAAGPATVQTLHAALEGLAPDDAYYAHDDFGLRTENVTEDEPANAPAHLAQVFLGKTSECVPVVDGRLRLGPEQRVLFVELDSSRVRRYVIQVVGR